MTEVVFGKYDFRLEERENGRYIFDEIRKKFLALTPEEWVRQHVLHYLIHDRNYPKSLIAVERGVELNGLQKRFDILVFGKDGAPKMIVECKAPEEPLNEKVFEQIARYNLSLNVRYLWVTNGSFHFCCRLGKDMRMLETIPSAEEVTVSEIIGP